MQTDLTVYYDGGCPLCRAEIGHYRRAAGAERVAFVDVQAGGSLGPGLDCAAALRRFHVREPDGRLVSGAAAFALLWRALPAWAWLGRLLGLRLLGRRPVLAVAERAYRISLRLRPRLARLMAGRRHGGAPGG